MKQGSKNTARPAPAKAPAPKKDSARGKTDLPGQNPKQNDAPDHDVHHDENRQASQGR